MTDQPIMDLDGNISLHGRDDLDLRIKFSFLDETDTMVFENCSACKLYLEVRPGGVRRELAQDPDYPGARRMQLTTDDIGRIKRTSPSGEAEYCVRDETGIFSFVRLDGLLRFEGFVS